MKFDCNKAAGQRVRRLREERGLTQTQLAASIGVDTSSLSRMESGRRKWTLDALSAAAAALDVNVAVLVAAPTPGRVQAGDAAA